MNKQTPIALGIMTAGYMRAYADESDPPQYTVAMMTNDVRRGYMQSVAWLDSLRELRELVDRLRADNRLGDIAVEVGPGEDGAALYDALIDTRPFSIN